VALVFVSTGTQASTGPGASLTPALPASLAAGDLMLMQIAATANKASTFNIPAGWNKISFTDSATSNSLALYWRVFVAGDSAPTVTWTGNTSATGVISRFTGNDTSSPIGAVGTVTAGASSTHTSTALTTTRNNSLVVLFDGASATTGLTTPAGWAQNYLFTVLPAETCDGKAIASSGTSSGATSSAGGSATFVTQQIELLSPSAAAANTIPPEPLWDNRPKWRYQLPIFDQPEFWRNLGILVPTRMPPEPFWDSVKPYETAKQHLSRLGFEPPPWRNLGILVPTVKPSEPWFDPPKRWVAPPGFEIQAIPYLGIPVPTTKPSEPWFDPPVRWKAPPGFVEQPPQFFGVKVPTAAPQSEWWQSVKQPSRQTIWNIDVLRPLAAAVVQPPFVPTDWWTGARSSQAQSWTAFELAAAAGFGDGWSNGWASGFGAGFAPSPEPFWDNRPKWALWNRPVFDQPEFWRNRGIAVPTTIPPPAWFDPPNRWVASNRLGFEPYSLQPVVPTVPGVSQVLNFGDLSNTYWVAY